MPSKKKHGKGKARKATSRAADDQTSASGAPSQRREQSDRRRAPSPPLDVSVSASDFDTLSLARDEKKRDRDLPDRVGSNLTPDAVDEAEGAIYQRGLERPESDFCPLCMLPFEAPRTDHAIVRSCCMQPVCTGCYMIMEKRGMGAVCPFCREGNTANADEDSARVRNRANAGCSAAVFDLGYEYADGRRGRQKDMSMAIKCWTQAAELGSLEACTKLGMVYYHGEYGVKQNKPKAVQYWVRGALEGDSLSRCSLGFVEMCRGNVESAIRHFLIAARLGLEGAVCDVKELFVRGQATKAQYEKALINYRHAVEETKSPDREQAKKDYVEFGLKNVHLGNMDDRTWLESVRLSHQS